MTRSWLQHVLFIYNLKVTKLTTAALEISEQLNLPIPGWDMVEIRKGVGDLSLTANQIDSGLWQMVASIVFPPPSFR